MAAARLTADAYVAGVRAGDRTVLARAITLIESTRPADQVLADEVLERLLPASGGAARVGISGVPGVGKSTFIETLGMRLIERGRRYFCAGWDINLATRPPIHLQLVIQ